MSTEKSEPFSHKLILALVTVIGGGIFAIIVANINNPAPSPTLTPTLTPIPTETVGIVISAPTASATDLLTGTLLPTQATASATLTFTPTVIVTLTPRPSNTLTEIIILSETSVTIDARAQLPIQPTENADPCLTTINSPSGQPNALLRIVHPNANLPASLTIRVGTSVVVKSKRGTGITTLYQIYDPSGTPIGWVEAQYLPASITTQCSL